MHDVTLRHTGGAGASLGRSLFPSWCGSRHMFQRLGRTCILYVTLPSTELCSSSGHPDKVAFLFVFVLPGVYMHVCFGQVLHTRCT